ncbi:hypothetical protein A3F66_02655 [candidate division TM6 bacterium RIFCSPHIGHO2_12_FULL_32_22]|nr:MAG: hypothetical protein A3F66_02655 [candidate division TM6 bacterium RIFCSPHIGHO2_12_FULL_32_22]
MKKISIFIITILLLTSQLKSAHVAQQTHQQLQQRGQRLQGLGQKAGETVKAAQAGARDALLLRLKNESGGFLGLGKKLNKSQLQTLKSGQPAQTFDQLIKKLKTDNLIDDKQEQLLRSGITEATAAPTAPAGPAPKEPGIFAQLREGLQLAVNKPAQQAIDNLGNAAIDFNTKLADYQNKKNAFINNLSKNKTISQDEYKDLETSFNALTDAYNTLKTQKAAADQFSILKNQVDTIIKPIEAGYGKTIESWQTNIKGNPHLQALVSKPDSILTRIGDAINSALDKIGFPKDVRFPTATKKAQGIIIGGEPKDTITTGGTYDHDTRSITFNTSGTEKSKTLAGKYVIQVPGSEQHAGGSRDVTGRQIVVNNGGEQHLVTVDQAGVIIHSQPISEWGARTVTDTPVIEPIIIGPE